MPTFPIIQTIFQFSVSALSNRSASSTNCYALCRILSYTPTAPHSLPTIRLYLFIFPGQIADCIIIFLYLLRQASPAYQIFHLLILFVKVGFYNNFSTQPHPRLQTYYYYNLLEKPPCNPHSNLVIVLLPLVIFFL